ncbi:hypothetical protein [Actinomadura sp. WMMB 499]|uniref:hypothetical protein n=1 Tax=Actinomadura sp. WMMB 499 TaxID=1219491 RepID=UPI0012444C54|nr:hypothetical protein [Actinomadura sp. WMMB 499]QFG21515.1 hypothetical protein F7P10_10605 [Actinomadura sp. WMMB 499]
MRSPFRLRRVAAAAAVALGAVLTGTALTAPAAAQEIPEFSHEDCPELPAGAVPGYWLCNAVVVSGGEFSFGSFEQQLDSPMRLVYANGFDAETFEETAILASFESEWMQVQEGIFGDPFVTAVYAKAEAVDLDLVDGNVQLDLRVRLRNPLLGSKCTIGTASNPIELNLTVGTTNPPPPNEPITGSPPVDVSTDPWVVKTTLVDNAFAVPGADDCGIADSGNWLVNLIAGLPSDAGNNTAVFEQYVAAKSYTDL